jgi:hypothetical protein
VSKIKIEVGKTEFRSVIADCNALWRVNAERGSDTYDCIVVEPDYAGSSRVFGGEEIRAAIAYDVNVKRLFENKDDFWARQEIGSVLHYHNGFGEYVRGVVINVDGQHKLKPTALVGEWRKYDLPYRLPNGSIYYPHHADKIVHGGSEAAWAPHESCVYESPEFSPNPRFRDVYPRNLPAIDLSLPEPTEAEKRVQKLEQARQHAQKLLSEVGDPVAAIKAAQVVLEGALEDTGAEICEDSR